MSDKEENACCKANLKHETTKNKGKEENKQKNESCIKTSSKFVIPNNYDSDVVAKDLEIEAREISQDLGFC